MDNLNVDMLLDNEIKEIENTILEKQNPPMELKDNGKLEIPNVPPLQSKIGETKVKMPTKTELIDNYIKLGQVSNYEIESEARLKRMTKNELTKKIAELMNRELGGQQLTSNPGEGEIAEDIQRMKAGEKPKLSTQQTTEQLSFITECLFQFNMTLCVALENGSELIKHKTNNTALLEGWSSKIMERKAHLITIFNQIYADHKDTIDVYLSPIAQWVTLMFMTGGITIASNIKKKQETLEGKSV
jgi:hypothetical protein